jgi:hypothetical protein
MGAVTERDVLRRMLETDGCCYASIWLRNRKTGAWYCWDFCNDQPGHELPHSVRSARDGQTWATWGPGCPLSSIVDLTDAEARPSPWTPDEIVILRGVRDDMVTADGNGKAH